MNNDTDRWLELDAAMANPSASEIAAMKALGSQVGAVGYDERGRLVRVASDRSLEVLEDSEESETS